MRGPVPLRRTAVMSRDQVDRLLATVVDPEFRDFLHGLLWTGCRPIELCTLTAEGVDLEEGTWTVRDKIRGKTGSPTRRVYLSKEALKLSRRLVKAHPTGPLFRNTRNEAWTRWAYSHRLRRLRVPLGIGAEGVAYSLRHLFATDLLEKGVAPATVAELMGHRSLTMVMRIYNQLGQRTQHLRRAVEGRGKGAK